jgi:uncharacterized protein (TIGR03083 family)
MSLRSIRPATPTTVAAMDHTSYCDALEGEAKRLVEVVRGVDPTSPVPTCPDWTLADLLTHLGGVHRWASHHVATLARARVPGSELGLKPPDDPKALPDWLDEGIEPMVTTFRGADPDAEVWGWGADRHARFWPRRMVHETAVHRADAAITAGVEPAIDAAIAADGIDELLVNLPHAAYFAPGVGELRGGGESIGLRATDSDATWFIKLHPGGFAWDWSAATADVTARGSAEDLLLLLYGRRAADDPARFVRTGDLAVLDRFIANASL